MLTSAGISNLVLSAGSTIEQNEPFSVTVDILNDGSSTFTGEFAIDLYDFTGEFAEEIETISGAELDAGYFYDDVEFTTAGVSVEPGTYLLALTHRADGGDWYLSGSSNATNPIKLIVKLASLSPDIYESNNDADNPYTLMPNYNGNSAIINTEGSNMHVGTDLDFYEVVLEAGFDYTIVPRVHDSYNSRNQQTYSNDVVWTLLHDGEWSELYDDVMPEAIAVPGGGDLLFGVGPYFEGETGTYLLDMQISRTVVVSSTLLEKDNLRIYPNPATKLIQIESPDIINLIQIYEASGRLVRIIDASSQNISADISDLKEGVYFIHVSCEDHTTIHKIVKQ